MIKANELRIGNYVGIAEFMNFKVAKVTNVRNDRILAEINSDVFSSKNNKLIPIELTEEILFKCGAVKSGVVFKLSPINIWWSSYAGCFCFRYMNVGEDADRHVFIKYIHQLQNLYFALTGEELTVKL